jgi:hypothetical protein
MAAARIMGDDRAATVAPDHFQLQSQQRISQRVRGQNGNSGLYKFLQGLRAVARDPFVSDKHRVHSGLRQEAFPPVEPLATR